MRLCFLVPPLGNTQGVSGSNHTHLVLRNRPDWVRRWSNEAVARRWCVLFPERDAQGAALPVSDEVFTRFVSDAERVATCRELLIWEE